ncbi:MAG TPA: ABC transporter permease [Clostridiales bacterium]|jgi:putative aldouronate transport system permease protein|nr:ABC transporter permease [Clostridiales bacterium]
MASLLKHRTKGSIVFDSINGIFMVLLSFTTLYPFLFLLFQSLGNSASISLLPTEFNTVAYVSVFKNSYIWSGFYNTIRRTFVGTVLSVLVTTFAAYALSKPWFPNRRFWTGLIVFTMFFSGGLIPSYLLIRGLGLYNSFWSMILPGLCSAYNMTIMRNFFMSIPFELEESAKIDGANDIQVMLRIVIPISLPILATVSLWNAVGHWNAWFDCMIYITEPRNQVLQLILRHIVIEGTSQYMSFTGTLDTGTYTPEAVKAATTIVATLPILLVYPFIQKYFVKGVIVGSLKG